MSGLFGRLAARALGGASPVRPLATTPYASPPALLEEDSVAVPPAEPRLDPAKAAPTEVSGGAANAVTARDAEPARFTTNGRATESMEPTLAAALPGFSVESPRVEARVRARQASMPFEPPAPRSRPEAPPMVPPVVPPSSVPSLAASFLPVAPPTEPARDRGQSAAIATPPSLLPTPPLLRPRSVAVASPERSAPSEVELERATAETTTEVHVSIGRIEVTALGAPPPARRRANPAQKPLSLADYLNARQSRRR